MRINFPRVVYHATEEARIVADAAEHQQALAQGWANRPQDPPVPEPERDPLAEVFERLDRLEAQLAAKKRTK